MYYENVDPDYTFVLDLFARAQGYPSILARVQVAWARVRKDPAALGQTVQQLDQFLGMATAACWYALGAAPGVPEFATHVIMQQPFQRLIYVIPSPFAPSGSNCLNFKLPVESSIQSQPLQDVLL